MSFSSIDDLISELTAGKYFSFDWNKNTASALIAGRWYDTSSWLGTPRANDWSGTALTWTTCDESTGNGTSAFGIPHGGNVSTDTKHVLNVAGLSATIPRQLMLVDLQGYWPGISTNSSDVQTLSGTPSLRYTDGNGCRLFFVQTSTAGTTSFSINLSYTNQAGTSGRVLPVTVGMTASAVASHIAHSGVGSTNYGPFLPFANEDNGVRNVASVTMSAASGAGAGALCIARPILTLPLVSAYIMAERDLLNQFPSLPTINDGACLVWLYYTGAAVAANINTYGKIDYAWG